MTMIKNMQRFNLCILLIIRQPTPDEKNKLNPNDENNNMKSTDESTNKKNKLNPTDAIKARMKENYKMASHNEII